MLAKFPLIPSLSTPFSVPPNTKKNEQCLELYAFTIRLDAGQLRPFNLSKTMKLFSKIANLLLAAENCDKSNNAEWSTKHRQTIRELVKEHMPSGAGFDAGTSLDEEGSKPEKLVFNAPFHHMDENGFYDGWTDHLIIVTPSLVSGYALKITGRDRNGIKEDIAEVFSNALKMEV